MKSNKYSNYNPNQEVLTELLGQLMRSGGRSSSGFSGRSRGSGGGLSRNGTSSIRRSAVRPRRRPVSTELARRNPKPSSAPAQPAKKSGGAVVASSTSASNGQKRSATGNEGPEKKKPATEEKKDVEKDKELEDPYLKGLCETGVRWYKRYLKEGLEPKVACKRAWEHRTEPSEYEPQWGKELEGKDVPREIIFRPRGRDGRSTKREINEELRLVVHPKDFPDQMLDLPSVITLEEAIMADVAKGADNKLQFTYAHLRPGALLVDCVNEETVKWLKEAVTKLSTWNGPELTTCLERVIPDAYVMTVALPKSIGQEFDRTVALFAAQNEDLNTEVWKFVNEREENEKQVVTIRVDKDSFNTIKRYGYKLYYRFDKVEVHFHRYLRFNQRPILWITNPSCLKQNQVKPPGPTAASGTK